MAKRPIAAFSALFYLIVLAMTLFALFSQKWYVVTTSAGVELQFGLLQACASADGLERMYANYAAKKWLIGFLVLLLECTKYKASAQEASDAASLVASVPHLQEHFADLEKGYIRLYNGGVFLLVALLFATLEAVVSVACSLYELGHAAREAANVCAYRSGMPSCTMLEGVTKERRRRRRRLGCAQTFTFEQDALVSSFSLPARFGGMAASESVQFCGF